MEKSQYTPRETHEKCDIDLSTIYYLIKLVEKHGMEQLMSRKGKSTDNGLIESFFATLKWEMFHGFKRDFNNISALNQVISNYINHYNTKRIKSKLKGRTPIEHLAFVLKQVQ